MSQKFRLVTCLLLTTALGCGSVTSLAGSDGGPLADVVQSDAGRVPDMELSESRPDAGDALGVADARLTDGPPLLPCKGQMGPLSYFIACSGQCATECRDNVAKPFVGCISNEGKTCVAACEECPQ